MMNKIKGFFNRLFGANSKVVQVDENQNQSIIDKMKNFEHDLNDKSNQKISERLEALEMKVDVLTKTVKESNEFDNQLASAFEELINQLEQIGNQPVHVHHAHDEEEDEIFSPPSSDGNNQGFGNGNDLN